MVSLIRAPPYIPHRALLWMEQNERKVYNTSKSINPNILDIAFVWLMNMKWCNYWGEILFCLPFHIWDCEMPTGSLLDLIQIAGPCLIISGSWINYWGLQPMMVCYDVMTRPQWSPRPGHWEYNLVFLDNRIPGTSFLWLTSPKNSPHIAHCQVRRNIWLDPRYQRLITPFTPHSLSS